MLAGAFFSLFFAFFRIFFAFFLLFFAFFPLFLLHFRFASIFSLKFRLFYLRFRFRFLVFRIEVNHVKSGFFFASKRNDIFTSISDFASEAKVRAHPTHRRAGSSWGRVALLPPPYRPRVIDFQKRISDFFISVFYTNSNGWSLYSRLQQRKKTYNMRS